MGKSKAKDGWKGLSLNQFKAGSGGAMSGTALRAKKAARAASKIQLNDRIIKQIIDLDERTVLCLMQRGRRKQHIGHLLTEINEIDEEAGDAAQANWNPASAAQEQQPPQTPATQMLLR